MIYNVVLASGVQQSDFLNLPANAGDIRDMDSIHGLGRSPGGGQPTPVFLPGESPWTEEPGGLQSLGLQKVGTTEQLTTLLALEAC